MLQEKAGSSLDDRLRRNRSKGLLDFVPLFSRMALPDPFHVPGSDIEHNKAKQREVFSEDCLGCVDRVRLFCFGS